MYWDMGLSHALSDALKVPEPSVRFVIALFSAYLFSFIHRYYVHRQKVLVQNLFWTLSGILMIVYIYGWGVWHMLVDVLAVYCTLWLCGGTLVSVVITWIITMGHLMAGYIHVMYSNRVHPVAWTIPHCVLVLKLIGLSLSLYDGHKKQEASLGEDMRKCAIKRVPSLLEVMGFSFFPGTVLAGPQVWYIRYQNFVEGRLVDYQAIPDSTYMGLRRLLLGTILCAVYAILNKYYPIDFLTTQGYADEPYLRKLWLVCISGKVVLWRYVAVWLIAEGSCIVSGISYNGTGKDGRPDWSGLTNIKLWDFETCITLRGVVDSFNVNTNQWMAMYVYKRLKWLGNKEVSVAITLAFVSLWHGLWPGYHICFSLEFICLVTERTFTDTVRKMLGGPLSETNAAVRLPLSLVAYILKSLLLMYPLTCFMLLNWAHCYAFMKAVYFYAHIMTFSWLVFYQLMRWHQRRKKSKSRQKKD